MSTRVFVGRLSFDVRERDLEKFFKGFGKIKEIVVKNGFGFVEFDDYRDADDAVYELNGKSFMGERVSVEHARGSPRGGDVWNPRSRRMPMRRRRGRDRYGPPTRTEYRLIVENLSSRVSWQDLKDYIRQAGEVTYADAHKQRRNQGIVELASYTDMKNAIEKLDDTELNGRRIRLVEDKSRRRRSNSRSRSRSRSRSDNRSRSRSASKSRSRSRSRSKSRSHSKSKSPVHSRSPSKSPAKSKSKSRSPSRDRSSRSKSASRSPPRDENNAESANDQE